MASFSCSRCDKITTAGVSEIVCHCPSLEILRCGYDFQQIACITLGSINLNVLSCLYLQFLFDKYMNVLVLSIPIIYGIFLMHSWFICYGNTCACCLLKPNIWMHGTEKRKLCDSSQLTYNRVSLLSTDMWYYFIWIINIFLNNKFIFDHVCTSLREFAFMLVNSH